MIIGNMVRYFLIKYGIDNPLLYHPVLFTTAAGISSFLSIASKLTIESLFDIISDNELDIAVGDRKIIHISDGQKTTFKATINNREGLSSKTNNLPSSDLEDKVSGLNINTIEYPDFTKLDNLLSELKRNIGTMHNQQLADIKREIDNQINNLSKVGS